MKNILIFLTLAISLSMGLESQAQKLSAKDGVRISFLDIKDIITGDYFIEPTGLLQLPFIGIINTTDKDIKEIISEIKFRYDSLYKNPQLTVHALFRINILGEVNSPGFYYVSELEKFTAIIALAGGTTGNADLESIKLLRNFEEIQLDVETIIKEGSSATDFGLQSGDQIFIPRTWWADAKGLTILISAASLVVVIIALIAK